MAGVCDGLPCNVAWAPAAVLCHPRRCNLGPTQCTHHDPTHGIAPPPQPAGAEAALLACFPEANRQLRRMPHIDCELSGSTGVVALLLGQAGVWWPGGPDPFLASGWGWVWPGASPRGLSVYPGLQASWWWAPWLTHTGAQSTHPLCRLACPPWLLQAGQLVVGNLGDSRCVVGRPPEAGTGGAGVCSARLGGRAAAAVAVALTRDHTPEEADEAARVEASGVRGVEAWGGGHKSMSYVSSCAGTAGDTKLGLYYATGVLGECMGWAELGCGALLRQAGRRWAAIATACLHTPNTHAYTHTHSNRAASRASCMAASRSAHRAYGYALPTCPACA